MGENKNTIFLTGATGLIGSYLVKIFLQKGHKVYVLSRSKNGKKARDRVIGVLNFWGNKNISGKLDNLIILEGDITKKNLSFNKKSRDLLKNEIDEIFHSAAVTDVNWPLKEIKKVNVGGTRNVLDLACEYQKKGKLKKINYFSTAYVCGDCRKRFNEKDLDVGQKFNTSYEQSKFEGEKLVAKYRKGGLWIDVFRPSLVIGESTTGKILQSRNIYNFIDLCKVGIFDALPLLDTHINLVPVDSVAFGIYIISLHTKEKNKNYHPFPEGQVSMSDIIESASEIMEFKKPKIVSLNNFNINKCTPAQRAILQNSIFALNSNAKLDSRYTTEILENYGFVMPECNAQVFSKILQYFLIDKYMSKIGT
ncbi:MAG: SDR family oxidoreductase [Candidatus Omnitrophica bacterium]|nr:SDR family oxidoreductase [Candidatus Omnitrophota bacterium]